MIEDHVPSRELCEKWKSIGGRQDTLFAWCYGKEKDEWFTRATPDSYCYCGHEWFAAPLEGELMEWYKEEIYCVSAVTPIDSWQVFTDDKEFLDKSLANALMQMAIELKEKETK